jgi:hypothetical protein
MWTDIGVLGNEASQAHTLLWRMSTPSRKMQDAHIIADDLRLSSFFADIVFRYLSDLTAFRA